MTVGELIKKLREEKDFSQRQLALYSEVSNTEISKIESGERQNPNPEILKKIASTLNIDYRDLFEAAGYLDSDLTTRDPELQKLLLEYRKLKEDGNLIGFIDIAKRLSPSNKEKAIEYLNATPAEMVMLPVLGDIKAGKPLFAEEHHKGEMPFPKQMLTPGYDHFLLKIDGDSMTGDGIDPNDIVLIRVQNFIDYNNQIAAVIINGCEACIKHVMHPENSDMVILRSSNPKYPDIVHPVNDLVVNGVYSGVFKAPKNGG